MSDGPMPDEARRPPVAREPLSLVLPVREAAAALPAAVAAWADSLAALERPCEVVLVDDGSPDATPKVIDDLAARFPLLRPARHETPRGVGAALRTGLGLATHPLVAVATLESPAPPADLALLLARIDEVDLVVGYRAGQPVPAAWRALGLAFRVAARVAIGYTAEPLPGWLGLRAHLYAWAVRQTFGVRIEDLASPLQLFRRSVFARIPIQSEGSFAFAEVLAKANFLGALMDEVPVGRTPAPFAASPWPGKAAVFGEAMRVLRKPDFGPP
jgi:glycosyltransferase involved in cell wall biosynthesis